MMLWLLDMLNLDGHKNLIEKFTDPMLDDFREMRLWVRENYNHTLNAAICLRQYHLAREMKLYHALADYATLYEMMAKFLTDLGEEI